MSFLGEAAEVAVIVAALPALVGAVAWGQRQRDRLRERRAARETRNWNGYIITAGIATWYVKLIEAPDNDWTDRVVLQVVNEDGTPNAPMAYALRLYARTEGTVSRSPTAAQWEFLKDLQKNRFNRPDGYPIQ